MAKRKICQKQPTKTQSYHTMYLLSSRLCYEVYLLCNRKIRFQKRPYSRRNHFTNSFCKLLYQKKIWKKRRWKQSISEKCCIYGNGGTTSQLWKHEKISWNHAPTRQTFTMKKTYHNFHLRNHTWYQKTHRRQGWCQARNFPSCTKSRAQKSDYANWKSFPSRWAYDHHRWICKGNWQSHLLWIHYDQEHDRQARTCTPTR